LVNKDWRVFWENQLNVSDILYYYQVGKLQKIYYDHDINLSHYLDNKTCAFDSNFRQYPNFLKTITKFADTVHHQLYKEDKCFDLCEKLIKQGVYYWQDFKLLLKHRYHGVWIFCFLNGLERASKDKRELSLIADRYESDLMEYVNGGNRVTRLPNKFKKIKEKYVILPRDFSIAPLNWLSITTFFSYILRKKIKIPYEYSKMFFDSNDYEEIKKLFKEEQLEEYQKANWRFVHEGCFLQ
jgi:hypothetical protein